MSKNLFPEKVYVVNYNEDDEDCFVVNRTPEECEEGLVGIYQLVEVKKLSFIPEWEDIKVPAKKKAKSTKKSKNLEDILDEGLES